MENKKKIILVVEDDDDLLELNVVALSAKDFDVLQARNGKEGLEWLEREGDKISLVLLDIVMPVMDGFEMLEEMKKNEKYRKIPVIIASNLESDTDRQMAFSLGAKDFFEKAKLNPSKVADKVKAVIEELK